MILRNVSTTEHVATTPIAVPTEDTARVETAAGAVRGLWREIVSHPERSGPEPRYSRSAAFHAIPYAEEHGAAALHGARAAWPLGGGARGPAAGDGPAARLDLRRPRHPGASRGDLGSAAGPPGSQ